MKRLHDISRPINANVAPWPGDTSFAFRETWQMSAVSSVNVGAFTASTHFSTHIDAPFHYDIEGKRIDELRLDVFFGDTVVLDCSHLSEIDITFLAGQTLAPRVLFRTDCWLDSAIFPMNYPLMNVSAPAWLADRGVVLIGLDVPSVDREDSRELPIHHALKDAGILIMESLWLRDIPAGRYELAAFPLKITGADAAPVRAVLIETVEE